MALHQVQLPVQVGRCYDTHTHMDTHKDVGVQSPDSASENEAREAGVV